MPAPEFGTTVSFDVASGIGAGLALRSYRRRRHRSCYDYLMSWVAAVGLVGLDGALLFGGGAPKGDRPTLKMDCPQFD